VTARAIDDLLGDLARAKRAEEEAKKARLAAEEAILSGLAERPDKGRVKLGDMIKATIEFKLGYKADVDAIRQLACDGLPVTWHEPGSGFWVFDDKAYEALRESNPALFEKVAKHVTTKPAKPSFELKL
jgi:hypothetical protein